MWLHGQVSGNPVRNAPLSAPRSMRWLEWFSPLGWGLANRSQPVLHFSYPWSQWKAVAESAAEDWSVIGDREGGEREREREREREGERGRERERQTERDRERQRERDGNGRVVKRRVKSIVTSLHVLWESRGKADRGRLINYLQKGLATWRVNTWITYPTTMPSAHYESGYILYRLNHTTYWTGRELCWAVWWRQPSAYHKGAPVPAKNPGRCPPELDSSVPGYLKSQNKTNLTHVM